MVFFIRMIGFSRFNEAAGDRTCESADQTDQFLSNNRRKVLDGKGRISHEQAIEKGWYFF